MLFFCEIVKLTLTVMTPLRPTFFMALEMMLPISTSPLAEIVATLKDQRHRGASLQSQDRQLLIIPMNK